MSSKVNQTAAIKMAPRLAEVWDSMSEVDREIASSLLQIPKHSETNYVGDVEEENSNA
jgi:hypothetical protein